MKGVLDMFSIVTKKWFEKALIRAVKTFAQTFAGFLTVGYAINEIDWMKALSVAAVAMIYSMVTSLYGLPELEEEVPEEEIEGEGAEDENQ